MKEAVCNRMKAIEALANGDASYFAMLKDLRKLEPQYDSVLQSLLPAQQDILCDYLSLCEEMNDRMLEIACTYMKFPD